MIVSQVHFPDGIEYSSRIIGKSFTNGQMRDIAGFNYILNQIEIIQLMHQTLNLELGPNPPEVPLAQQVVVGSPSTTEYSTPPYRISARFDDANGVHFIYISNTLPRPTVGALVTFTFNTYKCVMKYTEEIIRDNFGIEYWALIATPVQPLKGAILISNTFPSSNPSCSSCVNQGYILDSNTNNNESGDLVFSFELNSPSPPPPLPPMAPSPPLFPPLTYDDFGSYTG